MFHVPGGSRELLDERVSRNNPLAISGEDVTVRPVERIGEAGSKEQAAEDTEDRIRRAGAAAGQQARTLRAPLHADLQIATSAVPLPAALALLPALLVGRKLVQMPVASRCPYPFPHAA